MSSKFSLNYQVKGAGGAGHANAGVTRHSLFPTQIWQARLPQFHPRLAEWATYIEALRQAHPEPAGRTNRAGWNSQDNAVLDHQPFAPLLADVRGIIADIIAETAGGPRDFQLQSWVNMHDRGGFNFLHMHDNVLLSGCYYVRVPVGSGKLVFRDPRPGVLNSPFKGDAANACKEVKLAPSAGLLVLFPHWLEHYVEPHENDEPRIAIAMNALTIGA